MTKLSERIEACTGDTTELAAEMLTFVTGKDCERRTASVHMNGNRRYSLFMAGHQVANPLTDLNAIAALEREYLSGFIRNLEIDDWSCVAQVSMSETYVSAGYVKAKAPTEALARSAALVRALEVSREV